MGVVEYSLQRTKLPRSNYKIELLLQISVLSVYFQLSELFSYYTINISFFLIVINLFKILFYQFSIQFLFTIYKVFFQLNIYINNINLVFSFNPVYAGRIFPLPVPFLNQISFPCKLHHDKSGPHGRAFVTSTDNNQDFSFLSFQVYSSINRWKISSEIGTCNHSNKMNSGSYLLASICLFYVGLQEMFLTLC